MLLLNSEGPLLLSEPTPAVLLHYTGDTLAAWSQYDRKEPTCHTVVPRSSLQVNLWLHGQCVSFGIRSRHPPEYINCSMGILY